jgi:hypothetical protein
MLRLSGDVCLAISLSLNLFGVMSMQKTSLRASVERSANLQNQWYNGLIQGLGVSPTSFQVIQPSPPLITTGVPATDNANLWNYFNQIPPLSLTNNLTLSGGDNFFQDYSGVMSQMTPANNINVKVDIGAEAWKSWTAYLTSVKPTPTMSQFSTLFLTWATGLYPDVAGIGAADYAAIALNPITSAQNELLAAYPQGTQADYSGTYAQMVMQLRNAPTVSFTFDSNTASGDVHSTWSSGSNSNFFGLFGSSSSSSSTLFEQFSSAQVTVSAAFEHVMLLTTVPGAWYNSAAMNTAWSSAASPPWRHDPQPSWPTTFSADGSMQRFLTSLVVASGMTIKVHSAAQYSSTQQSTIESGGSSGFWPFYSANGGSSSSSKATFNHDQSMDILITSAANVPVVLGGTVLPVGQYVGHQAQALTRV